MSDYEIGAGVETEYGPPLEGVVRMPPAGSRGAFMFRRSSTHTHRGVDLQAPRGTKWLAAADGTVERVVSGPPPAGARAPFAGYGRVVVLKHIDVTTGRPRWFLYGHGDSVNVVVGQRVEKGDVLGTVGSSQYARNATRAEGTMGPHLHFEVSTRAYPQAAEAATRLDPAEVLRGVPGVVGPAPRAPRAPRAPQAPMADAPRPQPVDGVDAPASLEPAIIDENAKRDFRLALMLRLQATDHFVAMTRADLTRGGFETAANLLGAAWTAGRARILPLLQRQSRVAELQAAVDAWLADVEQLAERARSLFPRLAAQVERVRAELRRIWTEAIDWAQRTASSIALAVGGGIAGLGLWVMLFVLYKATSKR